MPSWRVVLLLSGGLDSVHRPARSRAREGYRAVRADGPLRPGHARRDRGGAARRARALGVARHLELEVHLSTFGGSALVGDGEIPKDRPLTPTRAFRRPTCRRATPCFCRSRWHGPRCVGAEAIVIGVNALDYSGYPDCRPEYLARVRARWRRSRRAPASKGGRCRSSRRCCELTKADIIRRGLALGLDYGLTHSCYDPGARRAAVRPLRQLPSCAPRGFAEAGAHRSHISNMTERLYYHDPYLREFDADVVEQTIARGAAGASCSTGRRSIRRPAASPSTSARSRARASSTSSTTDDGRVLHVAGSRCRTARACARRDRLGAPLRSHAAAHRPARAVGGVRPPARTPGPRAFILAPTTRRSISRASCTPAEIARAEDEANRVVWDDRPVTIRFAGAEEAAALPLRKEPTRDGTLRLIDVAGLRSVGLRRHARRAHRRDRHHRRRRRRSASRAARA